MEYGETNFGDNTNTGSGGEWVGAVVAGVMSVVGALITANSTKKANEANINNQNQMWEKTNAYNTPLQQRLRLEQAGFNPNLMAGAPQNTATNQNMPDIKVPDFTGISQSGQIAVDTYYKGTQTEADIIKKSSETNLNLQKHEIGKENLDILRNTKEAQIQAKYENLMKLQTQNKIAGINAYIADETKAVKIANEFQKYQNIKMQNVLMGKQAHGVDLDNDIKSFRANLARQGIDPYGSDMRQLFQFLFGKAIENVHPLARPINPFKP